MNGLILVKKEKQMTSHDVVNHMRRILHTKKVGHSGTLDPNVEGVLAVFVNKGTKVIPFVEDKTKEYKGVMRFGACTDTEDSDGLVIASCDVSLPLDEARLKEIAASFCGDILQIPPMYSAVKINGKKLYEYARENIPVTRTPRPTTIHSFVIDSIHGCDVAFTVSCAAGTYVRTLCVDVGAAYGAYAHMFSLTRTRVGAYTIEECATLDEIRAGQFQVIPTLQALKTYVMVQCPNAADVKNGKPVNVENEADTILFIEGGEAIAIYERIAGSLYRCKRGLW